MHNGFVRNVLTWLAAALTLGFCLETRAWGPAAFELPGAQNQTIRVQTDLVEVRAVVTDRKGRLIEGLTREDFELLEDNRPQEISFFSVTNSGPVSNVPGASAAAPRKSVREQLAEPPARTVVIFVDSLHLSMSSVLLVKEALRRFIDEQLTQQDMVALVTSAGTLGIAEQLTRDRRLLSYAVERIGIGWTRRQSLFTPYLAVMVDKGDPDAIRVARSIVAQEECSMCTSGMLNSLFEMRRRQVLEESDYWRKAAFASLKAILERMSGLPGQRILALFSDGFTLLDSVGIADTADLQAAVGRAVRSGVAIYSINASGLQPPWLANASLANVGNNPLLDRYMSSSELDAQDVMDALALNTGGESFRNTNDLSGALAKALDRNRLYYVLAYYPPEPGVREKLRRISVRVRNHPEYVVRSPKEYVQPDATRASAGKENPTPEDRLREAIRAPLPATGIQISAAADFVESARDDAQLTVGVHVDGSGLQYRPENDRFHFAFELVTTLYDSAGKPMQTVSDKIQGNLKPENYAIARRNGFEIRRRYGVKPGVYQARVGVIEDDTGRMGTAAAFTEVPNLAKSKLALSSLLLLDMPGGDPAPAPDSSAVPSPTRLYQGIRFYDRTQLCTFGFRVYLNNRGSSLSNLVMRVDILQAGKMVRQGEWQPVSKQEVGRDEKGLAVGGQVRVADFPPGVYELRIAVKDPKSKKTVQAAALFGVDSEPGSQTPRFPD